MASTVLQLLQDFTDKLGLPTPSGLNGVNEKSVRQYRALFVDLLGDLAVYRFQVQHIRASFTSLAGNDQGTLTSLFGSGYAGLIKDSLWNTTRRMRVYGPLSDQIWQALQILPNAGPEFQSYISQDHLYVSPAFVAGETISGVYITSWLVTSNDGLTLKERISADDDKFLLPDNLIRKGLEWRWRKTKGIPGWEDDYNAYLSLVGQALAKDSAPTVALAQNRRGPQPGIVIPAGTWNV